MNHSLMSFAKTFIGVLGLESATATPNLDGTIVTVTTENCSVLLFMCSSKILVELLLEDFTAVDSNNFEVVNTLLNFMAELNLELLTSSDFAKTTYLSDTKLLLMYKFSPNRIKAFFQLSKFYEDLELTNSLFDYMKETKDLHKVLSSYNSVLANLATQDPRTSEFN